MLVKHVLQIKSRDPICVLQLCPQQHFSSYKAPNYTQHRYDKTSATISKVKAEPDFCMPAPETEEGLFTSLPKL